MDDTEDQDQQIQNIPTSSEAENPTAKPSNSKVTEDALPSVEEMELLKKTNHIQCIRLFRSRKDLMTESPCPSLTTASSETSTDESNEALLQKIKDTVFGEDLFELVKTNVTACIVKRKLIHKVDLGKCPPEIAEVLIDLTTLINNLESDFLREKDVDSKLTEKKKLQDLKWA